ncbi:hypothetical protein Q3G72_018611 [Acer saccharum]|nr:hypothetical protein Q3G72_018611 [Acer saccharum]
MNGEVERSRGGPRASMNNIIKSRSAQKHESNQGGPDQRHRWSKSKSTAQIKRRRTAQTRSTSTSHLLRREEEEEDEE